MKRGSLNKKLIKYRVYRAAHDAVIEIVSGDGKRLSRFDMCNGIINIRFRFLHNFSGFLCLRRVKHGDIVLRHEDLRCAHVA